MTSTAMETKRVAVVTGGASGLGLATTARFLREGMSVAIWDRDEKSLLRAADELAGSGTLFTQQVDVTDSTEVTAAALATREALGPIQVLLASVGGGGNHASSRSRLDEWHRVLELNLTSAHLCCQAVLDDMLKLCWGRIILVSSMAGKEGNPNMLAYSTAKSGLIGYVKSLGKELATSGVLVNGIAPTIFNTPMFQAFNAKDGGAFRRNILAKIPMGRLGEPEEFAALAAWLASNECSYSTGMMFDLSGGRATY